MLPENKVAFVPASSLRNVILRSTTPVSITAFSSGRSLPHSVSHHRPFSISPVWQSNFTQGLFPGRVNWTESWLPLASGPFTRYLILGVQLHVLSSRWPLR